MEKRDTIQELIDLKSSLSGNPLNIYHVPHGYFDGLASQILSRIGQNNEENAHAELIHLSPMLSSVSKVLPYSAPTEYFDTLTALLFNKIEAQEKNYPSVEEELKQLAPLLSIVEKRPPYSVPTGYFETFPIEIYTQKKEQAKVIPIRKGIKKHFWIRYAAAAIVVGIIALAGILFFNPFSNVDVSNSQAWISKNMKKVSVADINNFIQLTSGENLQTQTIPTSSNISDIAKMIKDVSDKDIQKFLNETGTNEENVDDLFFN